MKDDMAHGWLLVASALSDLGYDNISELSDGKIVKEDYQP